MANHGAYKLESICVQYEGRASNTTIENKNDEDRWSFFQFDKQKLNQPSRVILISIESMCLILGQISNYSIHPIHSTKSPKLYQYGLPLL